MLLRAARRWRLIGSHRIRALVVDAARSVARDVPVQVILSNRRLWVRNVWVNHEETVGCSGRIAALFGTEGVGWLICCLCRVISQLSVKTIMTGGESAASSYLQ